MFAGRPIYGALLIALAAVWGSPARAMEFSVTGYGDVRLVASPDMTSWMNGGLGKFRYGGNQGNFRFVEAYAQGVVTFDDTFSAIAVIRAEPEQRAGLDALEAYVLVHPPSGGAVSWSAKIGAFYPTISLENDDLGWTSPYTLTSSAINTWIGEELRTIGGEGTLRWRSPDMGTFAVTGALYGGNDPAGVLIADRGWAMTDRPTGLFEHVREPDATLKLFHQPVPGRTGLFDEIDHRAGWYAGLSWQMAGIGKLTALRYDNQGDPAIAMGGIYAWTTKFWAFGARTQFDDLVLIGQYLAGFTSIQPAGLAESVTKFQSGFLLASYDLGGFGLPDFRASVRGDLFQTRHIAATPHLLSEDGNAVTAALSWQHFDWLKITGEALLMHSRRREYTLVGVPSGEVGQAEYQLDAKFFF
jgi:hypothetical protein